VPDIPAGSVLPRSARAGRRAGLVRTAAGSARANHIEAAIEALAECPSLPLGWNGCRREPQQMDRCARGL